jgi:gas vesicle protein
MAKFRKENVLLNVLVGTGLYLLDSVRDRLSDQVGDISDRARDSYGDLRDRAKDAFEEGSDRVSRAADVLRGEDHRGLGTAAALLIGVGVGIGVGMLFAPAAGEETRSNLAEKVQDFGGRMKDRFKENEGGNTGTYGA